MKLQIDNLGKVAITVDNNYWNINKDYDRLVVVEVKDKFSTYLSRKPVPAGTQITNREYWIPFSSLKEEILIDYNKFINKYKDQLDYYKESIDKFNKESDNLNKLNKIILTNKEDIDYIKKPINYYHDDGECVYDTYSFIIDQRGIISDPEDMVINLSNEPKDVPGCIGKPATNFMSWLKANTHAYVSKYTEGKGVRLKQLNDKDRTKFADGSDALDYITNENGEYDVFLKFNIDFYYKTESINPPEQTEKDENYILITFKRNINEEDEKDNWNKWNKNTLIGVYKGCEINGKLYSISNKKPIVNFKYPELIDKIKSRGIGFNAINYDVFKLFALLFYGWYSSLNSQEICGFGTANQYWPNYYPKITGQTNKLAMTDTDNITGNGDATNRNDVIAGIGENIKSVNFWGLENYWGDITEAIADLIIVDASREENNNTYNPLYYVTDYIDEYGSVTVTKQTNEDVIYTSKDKFLEDYSISSKFLAILDNNNNGKFLRIIDLKIQEYIESYTKRFIFGKHADIITKVDKNNGSENTYFCDYFCFSNPGGRVFKGYFSAYPTGGVAGIDCDYPDTKLEKFLGARICYYGTDSTVYIIDDNTETL